MEFSCHVRRKRISKRLSVKPGTEILTNINNVRNINDEGSANGVAGNFWKLIRIIYRRFGVG